MQFSFTVDVEVERESGKFATRDELQEQLMEALEQADPGSLSGGFDGDSEYSVGSWDVNEQPTGKPEPAALAAQAVVLLTQLNKMRPATLAKIPVETRQALQEQVDKGASRARRP